MKIGARGHDLGETSINKIIEKCKDYKINGLQLVVNKTWEDLYNSRNLVEIVKRINLIKEAGIEIYLLGTYFNPVHPNPESVIEGLDKVLFNMEIAKECDVKFLGSETGSVNGDSWTYNEKNHTEENFYKAAEIFSKFSKKLVAGNKYFLVEPVYDHVIYNGEVLSKFLGELNGNYKVTFDLVNLLNINNYKNYEKIAEEFLSRHCNLIKLIHLKNFTIIENKKVGCSLDKGFIDYKKIIELLEKYDLTDIPCIVEELEGENLKNSVNFLNRLGGQNG